MKFPDNLASNDRKFLLYLTYSVFVGSVLIISIIYSLSLLSLIEENPLIIESANLSYEKNIYIAVMSGASLKDKINFTYSQWYEKLRYSNFTSGMGFFIDGKMKSISGEIPYHFVNDPDDISTHKLISKLFAALKYFLEHSNAGWFLRICEDTVINLDTFPLFLKELNENFNPYQDFVIQGACLGKINTTYLQGGSGFVFSRRAAYQIYQDYSWFRMMTNINKADDRLLGYYLSKIGVPPANFTSRWFLGHSFWKQESALKAVTNVSNIEKCTVPVSRKGCRKFLTKVKDITFWHDRVPFDEFVLQHEKIRAATPDNLYFYVPINKPVLCLGDSTTEARYYD